VSSFSCCRKEVKDETVWMAGGRLFHARDAATGKARSPRVNRYPEGTGYNKHTAEVRYITETVQLRFLASTVQGLREAGRFGD